MAKYTELIEHNQKNLPPAALDLANQENLAMAQGQFIGKISSGKTSWIILIMLYISIGLPYLAILLIAFGSIKTFGHLIASAFFIIASVIFHIPFIIAIRNKLKYARSATQQLDAPENMS
jgi:hypothetical protein